MKRARKRTTLAAVLLAAVSAGSAVQPAGAQPTPADSVEVSGPKPKGRWEEVARMSVPRSGHTATVLPNGNLLIAGGCAKYDDQFNPATCSEITSSSEIFDPRSAKWTKTADMKVGRFDHTATLLDSGLVLVAGGCLTGSASNLANCTQATPSAELFDPRKQTWTATGAMKLSRAFHTATALTGSKRSCGRNCGKVLVVGDALSSVLAGGSVASEIYDPKKQAWSSAGTPPGPFERLPEAVLLKDGKVLVTGVNTAVYAPAQNQWEVPARSDPLVRVAPSATLLKDGKVLVAGGSREKLNAEIFDPRAIVRVNGSPKKGTWQPLPSLGIPRQGHRAVLLKSGDVLIIGGAVHRADYLAAFLVLKSRGSAPDSLQLNESGELFQASSGKWTPAAQSPTGRMTGLDHPFDDFTKRPHFTATLLNDGRVLTAGGKAFLGDRSDIPLSAQKQTAVSSAEVYTPEGLAAGRAPGPGSPGASNRIFGLKLPGGWALVLLGIAAAAVLVLAGLGLRRMRRR